MVDYNKPLRMEIIIDEVKIDCKSNNGVLLYKIYDMMAEFMNMRGVEKFNTSWAEKYPNWDYFDESRQDEYISAYEHYCKEIADYIADGLEAPVRLREHAPCLINFRRGWFRLFGYTI